MHQREVKVCLNLSGRKTDGWYIFYFVFNLIVAVLMFDMTLIFYNADDDMPTISKFIYNHCRQNDQLAYNKPAWFMAAIYFGPLIWMPYYFCAIYAFIVGDNRIRIPTIMYCSGMIVIYTMLFFEAAGGEYRRDIMSFIMENLMWLITVPLLLIKMLRNERPFNKVQRSIPLEKWQ